MRLSYLFCSGKRICQHIKMLKDLLSLRLPAP